MTAPSQTPEAAGLEVVATVVSAHGDPEAFGERLIDVAVNLSRIPYNTALVTAASAQARIDAEKARADRLAKVLGQIERSKSQTYGHLQSVARAALQQETQP